MLINTYKQYISEGLPSSDYWSKKTDITLIV